MRALSILSVIMFFVSCSATEDAVSTASYEAVEKEAFYAEAFPVEEGELVDTLSYNSVVKGITEAYLAVQQQGVVKSVAFQVGDSVKAGDVLVQMEDSFARLSVAQAEQDLSNAKIDYTAVKRLYDQGNASKSELLRSEASLRGREAQYENAKQILDFTKITAPFSGIIAQKADDLIVGSALSPGFIAGRLIDLSALRVEFSAGEREVNLIEAGAEARLYIKSIDTELPARVEAVSSGSDLSTGGFKVIVKADNPGNKGIRSGMAVEVSITVSNAEKGLLIPSAAILKQYGSEYVMKAEDNVVKLVEIEVKEVLGTKALVEAALEPGDLVLLSGLRSLQDGDPVVAVVD